MKFIENVPKERYNQFIENHPKGHILQTSEWGEFKSIHEWKMHRVGLENEQGELVAAALLLSRNLPVVNKPIIYSPRGFVIDFQDFPLLKEFAAGVKGFAKRLGAIFVKIDPDLIHIERDLEGNPVEGGKSNSWLVDQMQMLGFIHKGFELDFNAIQPRFVFRLDINRPESDIFNSFHQKTRYNIRLAERKGIEIIEGTREDLPKFTEIMKVTGQRDGFVTRPLSYFQEMYDTLVPSGKMKLFIAKYNLDKAIASVDEEITQAQKEITKLEKKKNKVDEEEQAKLQAKIHELTEKITDLTTKRDELQEDQRNHPDGMIISGAITLGFGDKAWYLYGASDNVYRNLMPNYLIQWEMIKWAIKEGYKIYDFRGISGDLSPENHLYGLYRFKKGFNGEFTEFIGEFDLVLNKTIYFIWETLLPRFRKLRRKWLHRGAK